MPTDARSAWQDYCLEELTLVREVLARHGYALDEDQKHLGGERAVISGNKLVLLGRRTADGKRVIIKASSRPDGMGELKRERACREIIQRIRFAYAFLKSPEELGWFEEDGCLVSVTEFIEQDCAFLERPLRDQFFLAMKAFEIQESFHAATFEQARSVRGSLGLYDAAEYLRQFDGYGDVIRSRSSGSQGAPELFGRAGKILADGRLRIEQYCGFLTHTDFVPHNFRVIGRDIYLLDHSSVRFGNKYEGWARFLNFMLLHNRELERLVLAYVKDNRTAEESEALELMRVYRLGEIVWYYVGRLEKSTGDLLVLDKARVDFWLDALRAQVDGIGLPEDRIQKYRDVRDNLRSEEEKLRQQGLH
jgi:hypothetical protein